MKMDGAKMKDAVRRLGTDIVKDLELQNDYDMLNKWMISYIAEQMHSYEVAESVKEKERAGKNCTETILKFWKHRSYNSNWNPLEKYNDLLETLNKIIVNDQGVDFINFIGGKTLEGSSLQEKVKLIRKVNSWLIEDLFYNEFGKVLEEESKWIEIIDDLDEPDANIINIVSALSQDNESFDNKYQKYRIERIEHVIETLNKFVQRERIKLNAE